MPKEVTFEDHLWIVPRIGFVGVVLSKKAESQGGDVLAVQLLHPCPGKKRRGDVKSKDTIMRTELEPLPGLKGGRSRMNWQKPVVGVAQSHHSRLHPKQIFMVALRHHFDL
jgi:hypothetical protein